MTTGKSLALAIALGLAVVATGPARAQMQSAQGVPNAMQGFSQNRDKPLQIDAQSLEVRDKDRMATFSGNVRMTQGDTRMQCKVLVVYYDNPSATGGIKAQSPGPGGTQAIRKAEFKGGVVVTQKDQTATGESGVFDTRSNTATLTGNVVLTQGLNVLKGETLVVDLTTGRSTLKGNVQGLFNTAAPPAGDAKSQSGGRPQQIIPLPR